MSIISPKSPRLTAKEVIKQLKNSEFVEISQTGSHLKLFNPETRRTAIVPIHQGKVLPIGTLKSIEKYAGITFQI
ncbi:MAG: type II toxin-antitoxin system HicA family toxin [Xenococcaceae cyanobacterium]